MINKIWNYYSRLILLRFNLNPYIKINPLFLDFTSLCSRRVRPDSRSLISVILRLSSLTTHTHTTPVTIPTLSQETPVSVPWSLCLSRLRLFYLLTTCFASFFLSQFTLRTSLKVRNCTFPNHLSTLILNLNSDQGF